MNNKPNRLLNSWAYKKAASLVNTTLASPAKLLNLVAGAQKKLARGSGKFNDIYASVAASIRLLKAYAAGEYREISLESIGLIIASIIYFVMPIDVLPDFIIGLGLTDDAALLAWTLKAVAADIEKFLGWEQTQNNNLEE